MAPDQLRAVFPTCSSGFRQIFNTHEKQRAAVRTASPFATFCRARAYYLASSPNSRRCTAMPNSLDPAQLSSMSADRDWMPTVRDRRIKLFSSDATLCKTQRF